MCVSNTPAAYAGSRVTDTSEETNGRCHVAEVREDEHRFVSGVGEAVGDFVNNTDWNSAYEGIAGRASGRDQCDGSTNSCGIPRRPGSRFAVVLVTRHGIARRSAEDGKGREATTFTICGIRVSLLGTTCDDDDVRFCTISDMVNIKYVFVIVERLVSLQRAKLSMRTARSIRR